jgi:opacity protein-like surface antigen
MTRILLSIIVTLLLTLPAVAADVDTDAGTFGVLFGFQGLDNLALVDYRGGVGVRWYPADAWALRPGVSYGWRETERPAETHNGTPYSGSKTSQDSFGFSLILERRLAAGGLASPYLGLGVEHDRSTATSVRSLPEDVPDGTTTKTASRRRGWGGLLVGGVEFGLFEGVTAGAEYLFRYASTKIENEQYLQNEPSDLSEETRREAGVGSTSIYVSVGF